MKAIEPSINKYMLSHISSFGPFKAHIIPFVSFSGLLLQESNKFSEALHYYKLAIGSRPTLACECSSSFLLTISSSCGCGCAVSRQQWTQPVVMWRERDRCQRAVGIRPDPTIGTADRLAFKAVSTDQAIAWSLNYYEFKPDYLMLFYLFHYIFLFPQFPAGLSLGNSSTIPCFF